MITVCVRFFPAASPFVSFFSPFLLCLPCREVCNNLRLDGGRAWSASEEGILQQFDHLFWMGDLNYRIDRCVVVRMWTPTRVSSCHAPPHRRCVCVSLCLCVCVCVCVCM